MTFAPKYPSTLLRVDVLWGPDVLAGVALAVVDVLRSVNVLAAMHTPRAAPVAWRWWCADGTRAPRALPRSAGFRGAANFLVVPGWHAQSGPHLDKLLQDAASAKARIAQVYASGGLVAGLHNGAALLGDCGLLAGRKASVPWPFVGAVLRHAAGVHLLGDAAWTHDRRIWTCDSPTLASEVTLDMLHHTAVAELALAVSQVVLHSADHQHAAVRIAQTQQQRVTPAGALQRARHWLETHIAEAYSLEDTARAAATSPRTLLRWFSNVYQQSPLDYLHGLRVSQASVLLQTTYASVDQIAHSCGYQDIGTFRRIFFRQTGVLPADYRARFRLRTSRKRWSDATGALL